MTIADGRPKRMSIRSKSAGKVTQQERMRERRESSRDIGRHQSTCRIEDKKRFEFDLLGFILFFFPLAADLPMSPVHLNFISKLEAAIIHGGREAVALPRGYGKSTIVVIACIWGILYGHRRYVAVIAATAKDSRKLIRAFKTHFERNVLLAEIFPEVCHYVRALDGQPQRASGQLANGERTGIMWTTDMLVLPAFEASDEFMERASQSVIEARGLTGSVRGLQYATTSGEIIRPELIVLDDPQTRESAKSPEQTATRIELIDGDVLGCAGPTVRLSAIMACTVIADDDLSEHYLGKWSSTRAGLVESWPSNVELWDQYENLYKESMTKNLDTEAMQELLNKFYLANRKEMDEGSQVSWEDKILAGDISAIQSAYNKRFEMGDAGFFAEYQNQPQKQNSSLYTLTAALVLSRLNSFQHRQHPLDAPVLFCAVDINYYALAYTVSAFRNDFAAYVVDYGWFPDGGCVYNANTSTLPEDQAIYNALMHFVKQVKAVHPRLEVIGIDGNCFTSIVNKFVSVNNGILGVRLLPLRGVASQQYREPTRTTPGLYGAPRTRCCMKVNAAGIMYAPFDSHHWHVFQQKMWLLSPGAPGSVSLHMPPAGTNHRRFAEQVTADKLRDFYERDGVMKYEWSVIGQNEMSDTLTMTMVLANLAGIDPIEDAGMVATPPRPRRRRRPVVTMS